MIMAITKKEAAELAKHINSVIVWGGCVETHIKMQDSEKATMFMEWHNDAGRAINKMLGRPAIILYIKGQNGEEY
jgi:hypothetical protein